MQKVRSQPCRRDELDWDKCHINNRFGGFRMSTSVDWFDCDPGYAVVKSVESPQEGKRRVELNETDWKGSPAGKKRLVGAALLYKRLGDPVRKKVMKTTGWMSITELSERLTIQMNVAWNQW